MKISTTNDDELDDLIWFLERLLSTGISVKIFIDNINYMREDNDMNHLSNTYKGCKVWDTPIKYKK